MANKISNVTAAIETKLKDLVADGTVASVERGLIDPLTAPSNVIALSLSRFWREDKTWIAEILLLAKTTDAPDVVEAGVELGAKIDAKIQALIDAGSAGGYVDLPKFDCWRAKKDTGVEPVGIWGTLRLRCDAPLLIP